MKKNHTLPPVPEAFHQRVQHTLEGLPEQTRSQRRFPLRGVAGVALAAALCLGGTAVAAGVSGGFPLFFPQGEDAALSDYTIFRVPTGVLQLEPFTEDQGRSAVLLSGGIDSPVAAYMIAKRGVEIECVHFFSYPYTSEQAREKVLELARLLTRFCGRMTVNVVGFTEIQEAIRDHCPEGYFTLIMRRFMMRIAQRIARSHGCLSLVTGENLGQVASQTMEAMAVTGAVVDLPIFTPLIGMDKEEIVTIARRIGTLDTSILPYEDCCTVFTPKHPKTKPHLPEVEQAEAKLDVEALIARALEQTEKVMVRYDGGC